jgi:hypothetical protein
MPGLSLSMPAYFDPVLYRYEEALEAYRDRVAFPEREILSDLSTILRHSQSDVESLIDQTGRTD